MELPLIELAAAMEFVPVMELPAMELEAAMELAAAIEPPAALLLAAIDAPGRMPPRGPTLSTSACSRLEVPVNDKRVSRPVSSPMATATTEANTATPNPRRIHSPAPRDFFSAIRTRPPTSSTRASEVAAPAA